MTKRKDDARGSANARGASDICPRRRRNGCHPRAGRPLAALPSAERSLLRALVSGQQLCADRTLDGGKAFWLHDTPRTQPLEVADVVVERLCAAGLVASNLKFPRASYLLTDAGVRIAGQLTDSPLRPLVARPA